MFTDAGEPSTRPVDNAFEGTFKTPDGTKACSAASCNADGGCCGASREPAAVSASPRPFENVGRRWISYVHDCDVDDQRFRAVTPDPSVARGSGPSASRDGSVAGAGLSGSNGAVTRRSSGAPKRSLPTVFPWLLPTRGLGPMRLEYDDVTQLSVSEPHGPVPFGALINYASRTVRIAPRWPFPVTSAQLVVGATLPAMTHTIHDVSRSSTVAEITQNVQRAYMYKIRSFADLQSADGRAAACAEALKVLGGGGTWRLALPDARGSYALVEPDADAESIDLFHRRDLARFVAASGVDLATDGGLDAAIRRAAVHAPRSRPPAQEHTAVANQILAQS